jgi:murein DD-endopeptidase MepM/ murein hydrolase activator NlpD
MRKMGLCVATATTIFTLLNSHQAAANATTDVGVKLAEKVASLLIGEAFSSIFGGDDPAATPQEVQNIVDAGFNKAALNEVQVELGSVMSSIDTYNWTSDYKYNGQIINDIVNQTGKVQTQVGVHMNHDNFVSLIKTYMTASTVRLAFLSERRRYIQVEGQEEIDDLSAADAASKGTQMAADLAANIQGENAIIASAALESVTGLANYFYEDFFETGPGSQGCIYKYPETPWVAPNYISQSNRDMATNDRSTVTCRNYGPMIGMTATMPVPIYLKDTTPWQNTDVMAINKDDLWAFSFKKWPKNVGPHQYDYHMLVVKGEDLARYVRNLNSITKYPDLFGDVEGQVISWIDIIASNGNNDQLSSALKKATELGVEHSKLTSRYQAKHASVVAAFEQWYQGKLATWGLSSDHAPTRISFNPTIFYPTDAPAWLADAMQ